jgi:hypothetical protein
MEDGGLMEDVRCKMEDVIIDVYIFHLTFSILHQRRVSFAQPVKPHK